VVRAVCSAAVADQARGRGRCRYGGRSAGGGGSRAAVGRSGGGKRRGQRRSAGCARCHTRLHVFGPAERSSCSQRPGGFTASAREHAACGRVDPDEKQPLHHAEADQHGGGGARDAFAMQLGFLFHEPCACRVDEAGAAGAWTLFERSQRARGRSGSRTQRHGRRIRVDGRSGGGGRWLRAQSSDGWRNRSRRIAIDGRWR
jgi:hypothetical protein